jgi:hypothetical protein
VLENARFEVLFETTLWGNIQELREVIALAENGWLTPIPADVGPIERINEVHDRLRANSSITLVQRHISCCLCNVIVDHDFLPQLAGFDLAKLDQSPSTAYALNKSGAIAYVNDAWRKFAQDNGAVWPLGRWDLGTRLMDVVPFELRSFYQELFERAHATSSPCDHTYECSSPTMLRLYRMRVYPLSHGASFVVNALIEEREHPAPTLLPDPSRYERAGVIVMCMHCRRTRRADSEQWDWVSGYVEQLPENTSHGLCSVCLDYHYNRPTCCQMIT